VLNVVQYQQQMPLAQVVEQLSLVVASAVNRKSHGVDDGRCDVFHSAQGREFNQPDAVAIGRELSPGQFDGQSRLAHATSTDNGNKPCFVVTNESLQGDQFPLTPDKWGNCRWQVVEVVRASAGIPVEMTLDHDGEERTTTVTPEERADAAGTAYGYLGVLFDIQDLPVERVKVGLPRAISAGVSETWEQGQLVLNIVGGLISGRISMKKTIGGPVMIARAAGDSARSGLQSLLLFIAWLSVNLGVLNLLPIPVLDGGHLIFLGAEAMRGRPLSLRVRLVATQVGMAFLLLMMIYVTYNDIVRWLF